MAFVGFDRPDGACDEPGFGRDVVQPNHSSKSLDGFVTGAFNASDGIFEGRGGQVMGGVAAIVVADFAQPAVFVARPVELVDEAEAFETPLIEFALEKGGFLLKRVRFIADDAKASVSGDINGFLLHG